MNDRMKRTNGARWGAAMWAAGVLAALAALPPFAVSVDDAERGAALLNSFSTRQRRTS
ncbi:hypothetical protein [Streptomyces sp. NPDC051577]|uniref:hypothetical protein n=1 Tax=Streptomyces sp. NPDC051577 TaxID=3155166 RepID=UPI00344A446F